jgi:hypothetical protein
VHLPHFGSGVRNLAIFGEEASNHLSRQSGLGVGGTVDWDEGKYSLYGEVMARTGLKDFGDGHVFTGTLGFRMKS